MNQQNPQTALGIFAHPDDAEFLCVGTMALLRQIGWDIHIATLSSGDKGSISHTRDEISSIRKKEGQRAADHLHGQFHYLGSEDLYITYDRTNLDRTAALVREIRPSIVFTCSPTDYMVDHEMVSRIAQTACFACGVKNLEIETPPFEPIPHLYYCDPIEGKDPLGNIVNPSFLVDTSSVFTIKEAMLCCHASQREWLRSHHGVDEYIESMKAFASQQGSIINCDNAEGFRQHLGHAYPQHNILKDLLPQHVVDFPKS